ncbi:MAG: flavodoxin domain-containing protein [Clostridium sp.]
MYNLIIYDSKYGSTEKIVHILEKIIGYSKSIKPKDFKEEYKDIYDNFIFISPVYIERLLPSIEKFVDENEAWLKKKKVYACAINMIGEKGLSYLDRMEEKLKGAFVMKASLYGEIKEKELSEKDYKGLKFFCEKISAKLGLNIPFGDLNLYNEKSVVEIGLEIKRQIELRRKVLDKNIVAEIIFDFIEKKHMCVLSTGDGKSQRATPLEYIFYKGNLYFISEGGVKFANLYKNKNAGIAIYNDFEGFNKLCGLQIDGEIEEVEFKGEEYFEIIKKRRISKEMLEKLEVNLYVMKFKIKRIEAINQRFKELGGCYRQTLKIKV